MNLRKLYILILIINVYKLINSDKIVGFIKTGFDSD